MIYALPLLQDKTIIGLKYWGRIFWLRDFSIAVFQTRTRSPFLKSKSCILEECSLSKWSAARLWALKTHSLSWARSSCRFWRAIVWRAIRSVVERMESGSGAR